MSYNFFSEVTNMQDINQIVNNELSRIQQKQDSVTSAYQNQRRMIDINQSYGERMQAYSNMLIMGIVFMSSIFLLMFIKAIFPGMPDILYNFLFSVILVIAVIYMARLYIDIQNRDLIDFQKIDQNSPLMVQPSNTPGPTYAASTVVKSNSNYDLNAGSCGYNKDGSAVGVDVNGVCNPRKEETFTTLADAYKKGELTSPNTSTEYKNYSAYK